MAILAIGKAREVTQIPLGPYIGVLLDDVESIGLIEYGNVLKVVDPSTGHRVFAVAAEKNAMAHMLGGGSHFICGYDGHSHLNYGSSDDYADRDKFLTKALELTRDHLKLPSGSITAVPPTRPVLDEPELVRPRVAPRRIPRPPARPAVMPMLLTLAGAFLIGFVTLLSAFPGRIDIGPLWELTRWIHPLGLGLFAFGCFLSNGSAAGSGSTWLRAAGIISVIALVLSLVKNVIVYLPENENLYFIYRISGIGFFMIALGCHAAFLMHLASGIGLVFGVRAALRLLFFWGILVVARFYSTWGGGGPIAMWVELATLLGMFFWGIFQLAMIVQVRRKSG